MKANFKMTLTAITTTAMCAAAMLSMTANADTFVKSRNFSEISESEISVVTQMPVKTTPAPTLTTIHTPAPTSIPTMTKPMPTYTKPMPTFTKPMPTYTKPMPTFTKPMPTLTKPMPETWINPCTDPIGPEIYDIDGIDKRFLEVEHCYMVSNIRTTTTEVNMAALK